MIHGSNLCRAPYITKMTAPIGVHFQMVTLKYDMMNDLVHIPVSETSYRGYKINNYPVKKTRQNSNDSIFLKRPFAGGCRKYTNLACPLVCPPLVLIFGW